MKAIYPGSFDPVTSGHVDIIDRASKIFENLVVAVAVNSEKEPLFSVSERVSLLEEACAHIEKVEVDYFTGLLVDYVESRGAGVVIRGLRAVSDFDYEFQMALMNKRLDERVETLFIMTSAEHLFLSSHLVKELAEFGASIAGLVPECVEKQLLERLHKKGQGAHSK
ncbi:MAG: pantetheine-phosphate adenylyltransferase [Armatimonadetes bacterium RBG_16_58_9]|nr:MAG: pantetheine-phosphate adenylyltransferase [Armatimonadetes bacterium RBG_16_58_9]